MKLHTFFIGFSLLFLTTGLGKAQDVWPLERSIGYALENNIQIKQQKINSEISTNNLKSAKADVLPNLNASSNLSFNSGRSVDPFTNDIVENNRTTNNWSLNSKVGLYTGRRK